MILLLSLLLASAHAAEPIQLAPRYGFEKSAFQESVGSGERLYGLGVIYPLGSAMKLKAEFGGWIARKEDRSSSLYGSLSWGFRVGREGFFAEAFVGPTFITRPDSQLGSVLQISHDLAFGYMFDGWAIGAWFKHFSNAGIFSGPNRGRDFGGMGFLIPFGGNR